MILRCCWRSSTASRPAHSASADLPVPARPPSETIPISWSSRRSIASRCSALRPCRPKMSRSPRTEPQLAASRDAAEGTATVRVDDQTGVDRKVFDQPGLQLLLVVELSRSHPSQGRSRRSRCSRSRRRARRGTPPRRGRPRRALTRSGRSLDTTTTSSPSLARLRATARMRESLSPSWSPDGSTDMLEWFSSTRRSRRPRPRSGSRGARAARAAHPGSAAPAARSTRSPGRGAWPRAR